MDRIPLQIQDPMMPQIFKLHAVDFGKTTILTYESELSGARRHIQPWMVESEYIVPKIAPKTPVVRQGKFECAAASLALLLGHSLFNVKSAMAYHGWGNDDRGASHRHTQEAAREFGRDLVYGGTKTILALLDDMPNCALTVQSLNYPRYTHALTWINQEIVDPNLGRADRKVWSAEWAPWTMGAFNVQILAKRPLSDDEHKHIQDVRNQGTHAQIREEILKVAA